MNAEKMLDIEPKKVGHFPKKVGNFPKKVENFPKNNKIEL